MLNAAQRAEEKARMADVKSWPCWPVLPVKRHYDGKLELGIVTADYPTIVIHELLFKVKPSLLVLHQLSNDGEVEGLETTRYEDVDALLDAGWVGD